MTKVISDPPRCELCGKQLRRDNIVGVCRMTSGCRSEYKARQRRRHSVPPRAGRKKCGHPGGCPNLSRSNGLCAMHLQRLRTTGELGPAESGRKPLAVPAGTVFGRWTTLDHSPRGRTSATLCRCECGTERRVLTDSLKRGVSKSCGCLKREIASRPRSDGLYLRSGAVCGRLVLLEDAIYAHDMIRARCECGTETVKKAELVKAGLTRSCGCLAAEVWRTHGLSGHPLYGIWYGMIRRCEDSGDSAYPNYGGRGITVCERWQGLPDGLLNFAADMGPRPSPEHSTERRDVNGNYEPGNCCWATAKEQNANRRTVAALTRERDELLARLEAVTKSLTVAALSQYAGIALTTVMTAGP